MIDVFIAGGALVMSLLFVTLFRGGLFVRCFAIMFGVGLAGLSAVRLAMWGLTL